MRNDKLLTMHETPELTFMLQCIQSRASKHDTTVADDLIHWPFFYTLILKHRVWHHVHEALTHTAVPSLPSDIKHALTTHCRKDKQRLFITAGETVRIARLLTKYAIPHCFIKGIVLNVLLYGALDTRPCRDIDIWVDTPVYARAVEALLALGYLQQLPTYALSGFKETYYLNHKHDLAFYHPTRHIVVELHFRLSYFGLHFFPYARVKQKSVNLLNTPITTLDDDYHLLYLILHGAIHAWTRLRWLNDIVLFIINKRCNLEHVVHLSKQLHCEHLVEQALLLVNEFFTMENPEFHLLIQNPSRRGLQLARLAKQFIHSNYEMTDGLKNPVMFFTYRFYLTKIAVRGQKIQAIWGDLFKIDMIFPSFTFPTKLAFLYYLCYPFWVIIFIWRSTIGRS